MKKQFLIYALLLASTTAFSQAGKKEAPAPVKVTSVEGITEYTLANGLRVLIFPDPSKATMTVNITYLVGSRMEGYGETGMAHLLEHMAFKGSTRHPNVPQELSSHGARPNGTTWYDRTNYFETFSASDENLKWALDLESDRMINSFIAKKDLETEFSVVRNEFERGENDPGGVLNERIWSTAFLWHNYGKSTIGSKEDIEKVPIENLQAFYHKYYQPDNAVLTIAGKVDESKTIALVNEYFGSIPKPTRVIQQPYTIEPVQDGERHVELRRVGDVQVVACGYHIPNGVHTDYAAIDVLNEILTNEPSGRLYKALVETKKVTSTYGYAQAMHDAGFAYYSADVLKEKSLDDAKNAMMNVFDSLKFQPVTAEELDRAKTTLLTDVELMFNKSDRVGLTLSEFIANGDWRLVFLYRDNVEKVTAEDVNRVAKLYYKPSNRTSGIFIPDAAPDRAVIPANPDVDALVKDYKGKAVMATAEAFDPAPSNIDSRTTTTVLKGGAKVSMLKKSTRGSSVNVNITLRIGTVGTLQNKATVSSFASGMLDKGSKNHTRKQIADEWDKLKAKVSIGGGGQSVSVSIETVKEKLIPVLQLVTEILHQPVFPAEEFDKMKQEELTGIEQNKSEPQAIAGNLFNKMLNQYDKADFRYAMSFDEEAAAVNAVALDEVKKFYADFFQSENATVGVVGDFDDAAVTAELKNMLEMWRAPNKYEHAVDPYWDIAAKSEKVNTPDKANAMMMAGYNLELRDDDADYAALIMGNYIIGGGFLNSRLATRIRQKEGISYGVGSWLQADPLDKSGAFGSYAIYNPDNSDRLIAAYKEELEKVIKDGFTAEELKNAISGYLQGQNVNRSQDGYLSGKLSGNLFLSRTMKWNEDLEKKIAALSVEQVNAAMRKWLKPEKITIVQAGDFNRKKAN
ncbi:pitrilysin family protein [soil metagenome]